MVAARGGLSVADLLRLYRVPARKALSQNFILDRNVAERFAQCAVSVKGGDVMEVGPGPGALTHALLAREPARLTLVEKDSRFAPFLARLAAEHASVRVVEADILGYDYSAHSGPLSVVGNLPFNVATPLLFQYLRMCSEREGPFRHPDTELLLCFQREVAERIVAGPGERQRCRLSVMVEHACSARIAYRLPRTVFVPAPKVDAAVVRLCPHQGDPRPLSFDQADAVVRRLFQQPRKTVRNNVAAGWGSGAVDAACHQAGVDPQLRPMSLTYCEFEALGLALVDQT